MLINCPKCGLSQPQDHFCARCGVDMDAYKPKEVSSISKILTSPLFQIGVVLAVSSAIAAYFVAPKSFEILSTNHRKFLTKEASSQEKEVLSKDSTLSTAESTATNQPPMSGATDVPNRANAEAELSNIKPSSEDSFSNSKDAMDSSQKPVSGTSTNSQLTASNSATAGINVRVTYALIDGAYMNRIYEESQGTGQFATFASYVAGLLPDIEKKIAPANARIKILHKVEKRVEEGKSVNWYLGTKTPEGDDDFGLTTSIEFKELDRGIFRGTFMIQRQWREKTFYPAEVELPPQNGFFIAGVLPRNLPEGSSSNIATISPFDVLKDPSFRSRSSEFVIFLELIK